jgi:lysophospholipase L1-like esterase
MLALGFWIAASASAGQSPGRFLLKDGDTIVFLGDSITQQGAKPQGYVSLFDLFCGVNGYEVKVINAGISGHESDDMLARLQRDVLAHEPDWVSVSCGVNDVWHKNGPTLPEYTKNMTEIVDRIQATGAKVLLLTATPIYENLDSPENKRLADYNAFLRDLAKEKKLVLADVNQAFQNWYHKKMSDERLLTVDGVHFNHRGNRVMARQIAEALGASNQEVRRANWRWELVDNMFTLDYPKDK